MASLTKRRFLGALLAVACDQASPPLHVTNDTLNDVNLSIYYLSTSGALRFRPNGVQEYSDTALLQARIETQIEFAGLKKREYIISISNLNGDELHRRTFLFEELDERGWRITITPEGIQ